MLYDNNPRVNPSGGGDSIRSVDGLPNRGPTSLSSSGVQPTPVVQQLTRWQIVKPYLERLAIALFVLIFSRLVHYSLVAAYLFIVVGLFMQYVSEAYMNAKFGFLPWDLMATLLAAVAVFMLNDHPYECPTHVPTAYPTTLSPAANHTHE